MSCDGNEYLSRQYQSGGAVMRSILMQDAVNLPFLGNLPVRFHLSPLVVSRKIFSMEHLGTSQDEACGVRVGPGCISSLFSPNFLSVITRAGVQAAGRARLPDRTLASHQAQHLSVLDVVMVTVQYSTVQYQAIVTVQRHSNQ